MTVGRFTEAELQTLDLDLSESAGIARCPFCGLDMILGVRKATRNVTLGHQGHADPTDPTGTRFISGCPAFAEATRHPDVMRRLQLAGATWHKLQPQNGAA